MIWRRCTVQLAGTSDKLDMAILEAVREVKECGSGAFCGRRVAVATKPCAERGFSGE